MLIFWFEDAVYHEGTAGSGAAAEDMVVHIRSSRSGIWCLV